MIKLKCIVIANRDDSFIRVRDLAFLIKLARFGLRAAFCARAFRLQDRYLSQRSHVINNDCERNRSSRERLWSRCTQDERWTIVEQFRHTIVRINISRRQAKLRDVNY